MPRPFLIGLPLALLLAACEPEVEIPFERGTCYGVAQPEGGEVVFTAIARDQPNLENCAARLEEIRIRFRRDTGTLRDMVGAYGDQFIFVDGRGVSVSQSLDGPQFIALRRSGDGRLIVPGAFEQENPYAAPIEESAG